MNTLDLGEVPACNEAVVIPLEATVTGTWAFMTSFNGAYQYVQFPAEVGQKFVIPAKLNEDYAYSFKLYQPDNSIFNDVNYCIRTIPLLPDVDYVCPSIDDTGTTLTTGKIQFEASIDQIEITHIELTNAKQVAVFVEGTMQQEGEDEDEYVFDGTNAKVIFNTELLEGQKITILYFK